MYSRKSELLTHRRSRRDRIDGNEIAQAVRDFGDGLIGIQWHGAVRHLQQL
jgi:hypothetical protein